MKPGGLTLAIGSRRGDRVVPSLWDHTWSEPPRSPRGRGVNGSNWISLVPSFTVLFSRISIGVDIDRLRIRIRLYRIIDMHWKWFGLRPETKIFG